MDKTLVIMLAASGTVAGTIFAVNFFIFQGVEPIFSTINIVSFLILVLPIVMVKYIAYSRKKTMEENFPVFLRDFVESIRGGMTVPQTLNSLSKNDYRGLNYYIRKMAAQIDWGIPVEVVLLKFAKQANSKLITRVVSSVMESHRFGGNLADTFEALSATSIQVERLKDERAVYLQSQMITGYIIFFVFLGVIIGLGKFLVPSLTAVNTETLGLGSAVSNQEGLQQEYKIIFRNLILIQGLFAGLTVGKMAEGAVISGFKHSLIMVVIGVVVYTLFA